MTLSNSSQRVQIAGSELSFSCQSGDTILRAALREGLAFPYECNVGSCGNCKFELLEGEVNTSWSEAPGLSEKDKLKNKWLGCQTHAVGDLQIKLRTADKYKPVHTPLKTEAWLRSSRAITHDLSEFRFELAEPMAFSSGQYALLQMSGIQGPRAYSMSTQGGSAKFVDFQVRRTPDGVGSSALFNLPLGERVEIDGPYGMAYLREDAPRDILCIAGGSGLAPMVSVARGALNSPKLQKQRLHFVYGARTTRDVCGLDMLEALDDWSARGHYQAVISGTTTDAPLQANQLQGFAHDAVNEIWGDRLAEMEIYFAGPPLMAQSLIKVLVDRKVPMDQVHFDQFY
jgi:toluene monooxygenase electron transfer component